MTQPKGTLIPIGGNEDKNLDNDHEETIDFITDGILAHVVREAGGLDSKIVVIPTASSIPVEVGGNYLHAFESLGCKDVEILDIRSKKDAEAEQSIKVLKEANCIMFSGGDQSKITDRIGGTTFHEILLERYRKESGFVIAGTSAGAMMMAEHMIAGGSSRDSFIKGAVDMYKGLSLIPELIIDTHFIARGRFGRQSEAIAIHPNLLGIGLAEDTGMIIKNGNEFVVIGSGMIIVFDPSQIKHNNRKRLKEGTPMTLTNMIVHVLANGDSYNIATREIKILPIESPFV